MRLRLTTALLFLLLAPAAQARVTWIVHGHGFGHGVGMSQYGAFGYAKHGRDYRSILGHYYSGTRVATLPAPRVVRVLLDIRAGDVVFGRVTSACGRALSPQRLYAAHRSGKTVRLRASGGKPLANCGKKLRAVGGGRIEIGGLGAYHGALEVVPTGSDAGSLNVIDAVPVDQYVKGVIPNEVPASWPAQALRAQAVATRSYALSVQATGANGFDLYNDTRSQVYKGIASETARSNQAVDDTSSQVVEYRGKVAQTYFTACSGGHTESVQNVFYGPAIPYLVGVPDPFDYYCPLHKWTLRFSEAEISAKLSGYLKGQLKRIVVTRRGRSPRILWARLYGTGGVSKVRGDRLQAALGAYDKWMTFTRSGGNVAGPVRDRQPSG